MLSIDRSGFQKTTEVSYFSNKWLIADRSVLFFLGKKVSYSVEIVARSVFFFNKM